MAKAGGFGADSAVLIVNLAHLALQGNNLDEMAFGSAFCERSNPINIFGADCLGPSPETQCTVAAVHYAAVMVEMNANFAH